MMKSLSKEYSLITFYLFSIIFFLNYSNPFLCWILIEVNLIFYVCTILFFGTDSYKQESKDTALFYFVIQSLASIILLLNFFFLEQFFGFSPNYLFTCSVLLKMGAFPFFFWFYKVSLIFGFMPLLFLLTLQKFPLFILLFNSLDNFIYVLLMLSFIFGSVLIFFSSSLIHLLVSSSVASSYWVFLLMDLDLYVYTSFFLFYTILISVIILINFLFLKSSVFHFVLMGSVLFLLGLPPLSLFFFKFFLVNSFFNFNTLLEFIIFFLGVVLGLLGYLKIFIKTLVQTLSFYSNNVKVSTQGFLFLIWGSMIMVLF